MLVLNIQTRYIMKNSFYIAVLSCLPLLKLASCLNNGLALTPPMGWISWLRYKCIIDCKKYPNECLSESLFKNVARKMVSEGYADLGYEYIILDDCWLAKTRDDKGRLQPDPERFPSGMKALADYIHTKGLKIGIYSAYGDKTCLDYPGILDENMKLDAETFAKWEIDYVKLDACNAAAKTLDAAYIKFGGHLNDTKRPIVYSCSWPYYQEMAGVPVDYTSVVETCNLWRVYNEIENSWNSILNISDYLADRQDDLLPNAGPGHWNDPDMLAIGNTGVSEDQARVQMAVWAIMAAPLLMSTDLANMNYRFKAILQNRHVLSVNQDRLGLQGRRLLNKDKNVDVWRRQILPMHKYFYTYAVAFVNRRTDDKLHTYKVTLENIGLKSPAGYDVYDLFLDVHKERMFPNSELIVHIKATGVVFMRFTPIQVAKKKKLI